MFMALVYEDKQSSVMPFVLRLGSWPQPSGPKRKCDVSLHRLMQALPWILQDIVMAGRLRT